MQEDNQPNPFQQETPEFVPPIESSLGFLDYFWLYQNISHLNFPPPGAFSPYSDYPICSLCGKNFKNQQGLKQHLGKVHHNSTKVFDCNQCTRTFKYKHALNFHKKQVHERSTRVRCKFCDQVLYNKYILKRHEKKHAMKKVCMN